LVMKWLYLPKKLLFQASLSHLLTKLKQKNYKMFVYHIMNLNNQNSFSNLNFSNTIFWQSKLMMLSTFSSVIVYNKLKNIYTTNWLKVTTVIDEILARKYRCCVRCFNTRIKRQDVVPNVVTWWKTLNLMNKVQNKTAET
jgi:hypothetical protein